MEWEQRIVRGREVERESMAPRERQSSEGRAGSEVRPRDDGGSITPFGIGVPPAGNKSATGEGGMGRTAPLDGGGGGIPWETRRTMNLGYGLSIALRKGFELGVGPFAGHEKVGLDLDTACVMHAKDVLADGARLLRKERAIAMLLPADLDNIGADPLTLVHALRSFV